MHNALRLIAALVVGLALGEGAAFVKDHGGFPHYNGYQTDPTLGVRLIPDFDSVLAFGANPPGAIHVNRQGYRGADWPEGRTGEVVVIGDSQAFGLGVNDGEDMPSQLEAISRRPVLNMGVPTYGPDEYLALIDEVAPRKPSVIVLELNFANDLAELGLPNRQRHVVLDGWAIRGGAAPEVVNFPGRSWLFQKSHLVYAARALLHAPDAERPNADPAAELPTPSPAPPAFDEDQVMDAVRELLGAEHWVVERWLELSDDRDLYYDLRDVMEADRDGARVGDVVSATFVEESYSFQITAADLAKARRVRREAPTQLAAWVRAHPRDPQRESAEEALRRLSKARDALDQLQGTPPSDGSRQSAFRGYLVEAQRRAAAAGAELVILAMPLDVQVDPSEFKKYGVPERDMTDSLGLLTDLCADAGHLGIRCVNPASYLRDHNPGMFLDGDLHLTAQGQFRVAEAVSASINTSAPIPSPFTGLPEGRSRIPDPLEWSLVGENFVKGSSSNYCQTRQIREYLQVVCRAPVTRITVDGEPYTPPEDGFVPYKAEIIYGDAPVGVRVVEGPLDHQVWSSEVEVGLVVPLLADRPVVADWRWKGHAARLTVPAGPRAEGEPVGAFTEISLAEAAPPEVPIEGCAPGQQQGGTARVCADLCAADRSCARGLCTDWAGVPLCL